MIHITYSEDGFSLLSGEKCILRHSAQSPAVFIGKGEPNIKMYRGNFDIDERVSERTALRFIGTEGENVLRFDNADMAGEYRIEISEDKGAVRLRGTCADKRFNRLWLRFCAQEREHVLGGGEQFSYFDLRGRSYPIWTREQGVGRNPETEITRLANESDGGGGDYHTTFFPQPTFISSRGYFAHLENYEYSLLDFRAENYHEIELWSADFSLLIGDGGSYEELLEKLSAHLGRQPMLPEWAMRGIWLGVQGGTERVTDILSRCREHGVEIPAVWIQDWEGKRVTSFGKRLQWDWRWNRDMYPGLDEIIASDPETRWLGYVNPYLVEGGVLFEEARSGDYFVKNAQGEDYLFDFGEFNCGVVDLTYPEAFEWYKGVIKKILIGMGFKGWMADFGEYLPADCVCHSGESGLSVHNKWPMLWAKCNREAVEEAGMLGECVFFMRSGAALSQRYSTFIWAGDQCVDYSVDDGLPSVITSAISLGMSGFGLHGSDAGGYTTLFSLCRDRELLLRWLEFAAFTPIMRTHEGNRPDVNAQLYSDSETMSSAARIARIHTALYPYMCECVRENCDRGIPVMRGLFMEAPECEEAYRRENFAYMLGGDMLVAPVVESGACERTLWLPDGDWVHLWTGEKYSGGTVTVSAPLGKTPVFYKRESAFAELFKKISEM